MGTSQSGNKLKYDEKINSFIPNQPRQNETSIGSANGSFTLKKSLDEGFNKGYELSNKITNNNKTINGGDKKIDNLLNALENDTNASIMKLTNSKIKP